VGASPHPPPHKPPPRTQISKVGKRAPPPPNQPRGRNHIKHANTRPLHPWFLCTSLPTRANRTSKAAACKQHHQANHHHRLPIQVGTPNATPSRRGQRQRRRCRTSTKDRVYTLDRPCAAKNNAYQWYPNRESDATTIATDEPSVEAYARSSPFLSHKIEQARRTPHLTSATTSGRALTQLGTPPWRHQEAPVDPQPHHHDEADPRTPTEEHRGSPTPPHHNTRRLRAARPRPHQHPAHQAQIQ
jgi:hypothetical protein